MATDGRYQEDAMSFYSPVSVSGAAIASAGRRWKWIAMLGLLLLGCKKYVAIPYDGGDDIGRIDADSTAADSLPDGGVDHPNLADAPPRVFDGSTEQGLDGSDGVDADACATSCSPPPPRLIAPLSTATATSRRPLLHWMLAAGSDGAHVQICRDRGCTNQVMAFDVVGSSGAPSADLPVGVLFWRVYGRLGNVTGDVATPTWQFIVGPRSAPIQASWGTTLDLNGDGYADLLIGASGAVNGTGRVYEYLGSAPGLPGVQPSVIRTGPDGANGSFGGAVASAGDVNGDGYADAIVGSVGPMGSPGKAYVYLGGPSGLSSTQEPIVLTGPDGPVGEFGAAVASAGDVDGDGYGDIIVGASGVMGNMGRAYVYRGGPFAFAMPPIVLVGPDGGFFGISVAGAGDVNGDGFADIVIGAAAATDSGRAYVYFGSPSGFPSAQSPTVLMGSDGSNGDFGISVASAGDVNGDGYADLVVGADGELTATGRAYVFTGSELGVDPLHPIIFTGLDGVVGHFGDSVASAGDLNGDGYSEFVVGAPEAMAGNGRTYVYPGSASGLSAQQPLTLTGPDGGAFGRPVANLGDINGDGYNDIAVGALSSAVRVYIYLGTASGVSSSQQPVTFTAPDGSGSLFGISVACAGDLTGVLRSIGGGRRPTL
jgi:hypothetical protein